MAGVSAAYQASLGQVSLAPFFNFDYNKTNINGYNENGTTLLELHYGDRSAISATGSLGARRAPHTVMHGEVCSHRCAWRRCMNSEQCQPDQQRAGEHTRYWISGCNGCAGPQLFNRRIRVTAALNGGTQLFLDYEKRNQDRLLDSWAVSLGVLVEF